ncbi:hypothetical protein A2U01_0043918, partial [Trifolium medium]|nr:hypothetical protein [Trifolium medium]
FLKVCKGRVVVHPVYWVVGGGAGFSFSSPSPAILVRVGVIFAIVNSAMVVDWWLLLSMDYGIERAIMLCCYFAGSSWHLDHLLLAVLVHSPS